MHSRKCSADNRRKYPQLYKWLVETSRKAILREGGR